MLCTTSKTFRGTMAVVRTTEDDNLNSVISSGCKLSRVTNKIVGCILRKPIFSSQPASELSSEPQHRRVWSRKKIIFFTDHCGPILRIAKNMLIHLYIISTHLLLIALFSHAKVGVIFLSDPKAKLMRNSSRSNKAPPWWCGKHLLAELSLDGVFKIAGWLDDEIKGMLF